jgi:hypothetical protein
MGKMYHSKQHMLVPDLLRFHRDCSPERAKGKVYDVDPSVGGRRGSPFIMRGRTSG